MLATLSGDMAERSSLRWLGLTSLHALRGEPLRLAQRGELVVRVHGRCFGVVSCAGRRKWCWGAFALAFVVPGEPGSVTVQAFGLLGVRRMRVELDPQAELNEPTVRLKALPVVASARGPAPRTRIDALPVYPRLRSRAPSFVPRAIGIVLRLPRIGENA
jgi:hypothetical protein